MTTATKVESSSNIAQAMIAGATNTTVTLDASRVESIKAHLSVERVEKWSADKNRRFKDLARREAMGTLTEEDGEELQELVKLRRQSLYPRTADEILWERKQRRLTRDLLKALSAYVRFYEPESRP